jgi:hypothetical protein
MLKVMRVIIIAIAAIAIITSGSVLLKHYLAYATNAQVMKPDFFTVGMVNVQEFGAVGNGIVDDTAAIQNAINKNPGKTIYFPLPSDHYYITDTITIPNSSKGTRLYFAGGNVPSNHSKIQIDDAFPPDKPIFVLALGTIIDGLTVFHKGAKKYTGIGLQIGNTGYNVQNCYISNCSFYKIGTAIMYGSTAYYNAIDNCKFMECNYGIEIRKVMGSYCGSLTVRDSHFWRNKEAGIKVLSDCNQVEFNNCTFEQNPYHVKSYAGIVSFDKGYFGDGSINNIYLDGGTVSVDGHNTEAISGAGSTDFMPFDTATPTFGVYGKAGKLKIKNLLLKHNIHGSNGVVYGTLYQGTDLCSEGAVIESENVKYDGFYAPKFTNNKDNRCEEIPNYIINGMFNRDGVLDATLGKGVFGISVLGENGFGGKSLRFTANSKSFAAIDFYYYAPHLVNKIAYLGAFIGSVSTLEGLVPAFYPVSDEYEDEVDWKVYHKYGNVVLDYAGNLQPMLGKPDFYSSFFAPVLIKKPFGKIRFRVFNPAQIGAYIDVGGVFLTDETHGGKLARFNDVSKILLGENAPANGTFNKGDEVKNINPKEQGSAGSKYIIDGWVCITEGTPGTWLQKKYFTGN